MKYNNQDLIDSGEQMLGIKELGGCKISEYHKYLLKLLSEIDRICKKNNILYFLMYGSLIGAVRHHGFIPWDDDADIVMMRMDFNRFYECCKTDLGEEFSLVTYMDDDNYNYTFPRLRLKNTTYIIKSEVSRHGHDAGFFVDIILLDYIPRNRFKAFVQKRAAMAIHRVVSPGFFQSQIGLNRCEDFMVYISKLLLGKKRTLRIAEKFVSYSKATQSDKVLGELFMPSADYFYEYDKYHFERSESVPFENITLQVPNKPITLLHECYYKSFIDKGSILEYKCDNEIELIKKNKLYYCNDIMFIPEIRSRERHLEIIFDCNHGSSYYDEFYFEKFDKKQNDKCAIKERRSRESARKAIRIMNNNEKIVRDACRFVQFRDYLETVMDKYPNIENIPLKEAVDISDGIIKYKSVFYNDLSKEQMDFIIDIFIKVGNCFVAKRMILDCQNKMFEANYQEKLNIVDTQFSAFYAIFERDLKVINSYLEKNKNDIFSLILRGIKEYIQEKYSLAEKLFTENLEIIDTSFWNYYFLGEIEYKVKGNYSKARSIYLKSLDCSGYMPQLDLSLKAIKEIDNALNKKTESGRY